MGFNGLLNRKNVLESGRGVHAGICADPVVFAGRISRDGRCQVEPRRRQLRPAVQSAPIGSPVSRFYAVIDWVDRGIE
jgi:hypothetical protein